ncbi:hypothetical protein ACOMHN_066758 [Nucella lapillus]
MRGLLLCLVLIVEGCTAGRGHSADPIVGLQHELDQIVNELSKVDEDSLVSDEGLIAIEDFFFPKISTTITETFTLLSSFGNQMKALKSEIWELETVEATTFSLQTSTSKQLQKQLKFLNQSVRDVNEEQSTQLTNLATYVAQNKTSFLTRLHEAYNRTAANLDSADRRLQQLATLVTGRTCRNGVRSVPVDKSTVVQFGTSFKLLPIVSVALVGGASAGDMLRRDPVNLLGLDISVDKVSADSFELHVADNSRGRGRVLDVMVSFTACQYLDGTLGVNHHVGGR